MLSRGIALICYLIALAGAGAFAAFVLALGLDLEPAHRLRASLTPAWAVDLGWLCLFGLQHSGMARPAFKRLFVRVIPKTLERSAYAALSGLLLLALPIVWQPIPGAVIYCLPDAVVLVPLAAGAGLALINARHDHASLFGLRQAWSIPVADHLEVGGPYRFVRHPLMACLLVFLWGQPTMTPTLLLLNAGLTGTILLGVTLEERDLRRTFPQAYDDYRRRVPMLLPWRGMTSLKEDR
jgi:methanethiol S-methyltransferase